MNIKIIAFDADDTLWENESFFQETEAKFCRLLSQYLPESVISEELFKTEMQNLHIYGYGIKSFTLSLLETALRVSDNKISNEITSQILDYGKQLLNMPIVLLPGVEKVLYELSGKYRLIVATKGDLLDQKRKLIKSGLQKYFHHVEIMSDKQISDYQKLIQTLGCNPEEFMMIGNSLKSDILPVLELGGYGVHIPFRVTWNHEKVGEEVKHDKFHAIGIMENLLTIV